MILVCLALVLIDFLGYGICSVKIGRVLRKLGRVGCFIISRFVVVVMFLCLIFW